VQNDSILSGHWLEKVFETMSGYQPLGTDRHSWFAKTFRLIAGATSKKQKEEKEKSQWQQKP
jgi:hypothetical protein